MDRLDGRVALVTGGGRGIGRSICELFAAEGATVAVNYRRDADAAAETVESITAAGGSAKAYSASVDDPSGVAAMVDAVVADFGYVDVLVCNAGIASRGRSVADTDPDGATRVHNQPSVNDQFMQVVVVTISVRPAHKSHPFAGLVPPRHGFD